MPPSNSERKSLIHCNCWTSFIAGLFGAAGVALVVFSSPELAGVDAYYHIQFARIIRVEGILDSFPWAQETLFQTRFSDKEFLFHLLLVPFAGSNPILGAKLAVCLLVGFIFFAFHSLLRSLKFRFTGFWTLLLYCSGPIFLYRMAMPRPHLVSLLILLAATYALMDGKRKLFAALAFVYPLSYSAPHLIIVLVILFNVGLLLSREEADWKPLRFAAAGLFVGLLLHPNFPDNLYLWYVQTVLAPFHAWGLIGIELHQGIELRPTTGKDIILKMTGPTLAGVLCILGYLYRGMRPGRQSWIFLVICSFFLGLSLLSIRFIEYFIPFTLLFSASAATELIELEQCREWFVRKRFACSAVPVLLLFLVTGLGLQSVLVAQGYLAEDSDTSLAEAARWLDQNVEPGETVFHTDWGDFPELFFHAPGQRYLVGLDPVFMYVHSPAVFQLWEEISEGKRADFPDLIRERFRARHILLRKPRRANLDRLLRHLPTAKLVYNNSSFSIYKLL